MAYIVDTYNKWDQWDREHTIYKCMMNDMPYAIKRVEMEWGLPSLPLRMEEQYPQSYYIYETEDEAMAFVQQLKSLNR